MHERTSKSFYVLEPAGSFDFVCDGQDVTSGPGDYLLIPIRSPHMISAHQGGGTLLSIFAPAGLQDMFKALSQFPRDSLRDPAARREISKNFDSVPLST
jgi:quercetin dioxygenase-like cupin family protein